MEQRVIVCAATKGAFACSPVSCTAGHYFPRQRELSSQLPAGWVLRRCYSRGYGRRADGV